MPVLNVACKSPADDPTARPRSAAALVTCACRASSLSVASCRASASSSALHHSTQGTLAIGPQPSS